MAEQLLSAQTVRIVTLALPTSRPVAVPPATSRPLRTDGPRTELVTIADPEALSVHEQLVADGLIAELESQARRALRSGRDPGAELQDPEQYPSMPAWLALRGSGLALHAMQRPSAGRLAHGIDFEDFLAPLLDGASAVDLLRGQLGAQRAGVILERHRAFCDAPMSEEARLLVGGALDAQAVRLRSLVAAHTIAMLRGRWSGDVRMAAVGATGDGAALVAGSLAAAGEGLSITLVDRNPMALVAAQVVIEAQAPAARVCSAPAHRGAATTLAALATTGGVDIVDLTAPLGALPDGAAVNLLRAARHALRLGGAVVAANMLADSPQQTFLEHVVRWPSIVRRTPAQLARLVAAAGFADEQVSLAIPASAQACAIATIDTAR